MVGGGNLMQPDRVWDQAMEFKRELGMVRLHQHRPVVVVRKKARVAVGERNVLERLVKRMDDSTPVFRLLFLLSDQHVAAIFRFLRPLDIVHTRLLNRSMAVVPRDWFRAAKLPLPSAPETTSTFAPSPTTPCFEQVKQRLVRRELQIGRQLTHGATGTIFEVCSTLLPNACVDYLLKRMRLGSDPWSGAANDLRIHQHLARKVPDAVPILYDAFSCTEDVGPKAYLLMERLGSTLTNVCLRREDAPQPGADESTDWLTPSEVKQLIAVVQRVSFEGGVFHADLHGGNVVQRGDGRPGWKVIDFDASARWDEMHTVEDTISWMLDMVLPEDDETVQTHAAYLHQHRPWFGVYALFERADAVAILRHHDPKIAIPADFLDALSHLRVWQWPSSSSSWAGGSGGGSGSASGWS